MMPVRRISSNVSFSDVVSSITDEELDEVFEPGDVHALLQCEPCSPKSPPSSPPSPTGAYDPTVADVFGFRGRRRRQPAGFSLGQSLSFDSASGASPEKSMLMQKRRAKELQEARNVCRSEDEKMTSKDAPIDSGASSESEFLSQFVT
jgi:hypothetical protein